MMSSTERDGQEYLSPGIMDRVNTADFLSFSGAELLTG